MKKLNFIYLLLSCFLLFNCSKTIKEEDKNGVCIFETKNNLKDGLCICNYKNGVIRDSIYYQQNLRHGKRITYDSLGNKISIKFYKEGKGNGAFVYYYSNGNVMERGTLYDDSLIGWYFKYYPNKILKSKEEYINFKGERLNNQGVYYNSDGSIDSSKNTSFISVFFDKKNIKVKDTIILNVELLKSYFTDHSNHITKLILGNFDSTYVLRDTLNFIKYTSEYYKFKIPIVAVNKGLNIIRGIVYDDIKYPDSPYDYDFRRKIYFSKEFNVK